ncbi:hypothetical protein [Streptomyces goshikiensis]|uniref:hypothetical protein n=1 Tax=Streptomyces goshikiensis TaxID=1942 RepID=UPI003668822D
MAKVDERSQQPLDESGLSASKGVAGTRRISVRFGRPQGGPGVRAVRFSEAGSPTTVRAESGRFAGTRRTWTVVRATRATDHPAIYGKQLTAD